ncbi:MAG: plasmid pRiA4b ORF-3 family protein, partial [Boseongicola sp. SB0676_bin_33]|nr:plasmid pRiA4b ORF-3 family protein [Boseongicola sp. SB0676_bin_33]
MTDARTAPGTGSAFLQLKVRLLGISPMIWRRVLVPDAMSLHELDGVLQVAMGWEAIHLFQFSVRCVVYAGPCLHGQPVDVPLSYFLFRRNAKFRYVFPVVAQGRGVGGKRRKCDAGRTLQPGDSAGSAVGR